MEITELRRQLHSQESEYKSLVRRCKVSTFTYIMEKMMLGCWQTETKDSKDEIRRWCLQWSQRRLQSWGRTAKDGTQPWMTSLSQHEQQELQVMRSWLFQVIKFQVFSSRLQLDMMHAMNNSACGNHTSMLSFGCKISSKGKHGNMEFMLHNALLLLLNPGKCSPQFCNFPFGICNSLPCACVSQWL